MKCNQGRDCYFFQDCQFYPKMNLCHGYCEWSGWSIEVVIWTIFKDREHISAKQLEALRQTRRINDKTKTNSNVRPVQPLNGRKVLDIDTRDYGIRTKDKTEAKEQRVNKNTGSNCRLSFMFAFIIQILLYFNL